MEQSLKSIIQFCCKRHIEVLLLTLTTCFVLISHVYHWNDHTFKTKVNMVKYIFFIFLLIIVKL